jgi:hypothetical protein
MVAAWAVDRLGRSPIDLLGLLDEMRVKKIDFYLHQQGLDTSTPAGRAMFQMLGLFAEFEQAVIRERVLSGLARPGQWHAERQADRSSGGQRSDVERSHGAGPRRSERAGDRRPSRHRQRHSRAHPRRLAGLIAETPEKREERSSLAADKSNHGCEQRAQQAPPNALRDGFKRRP